ncbi:MAG: WapI family immunity protein, partial [Flexibacteraceae bacterium]
MIIKGDLGSLELVFLTKASETAVHGEFWLKAAVYLDIPCITAKSSLYITLGEIKQFAVDLSKFLKFKTKEIQFETMETDIYLHFTLTETGNVDVLGKLKTS